MCVMGVRKRLCSQAGKGPGPKPTVMRRREAPRHEVIISSGSYSWCVAEHGPQDYPGSLVYHHADAHIRVS